MISKLAMKCYVMCMCPSWLCPFNYNCRMPGRMLQTVGFVLYLLPLSACLLALVATAHLQLLKFFSVRNPRLVPYLSVIITLRICRSSLQRRFANSRFCALMKFDLIPTECRFYGSRHSQAIHSGLKWRVVFDWESCIVRVFNCEQLIFTDLI